MPRLWSCWSQGRRLYPHELAQVRDCLVLRIDVKMCDKAAPRDGRPADDIFLHNQDWEANPARCPMYLTQILEVDLHWLSDRWQETATDADFEDDEKCLDYFHRF